MVNKITFKNYKLFKNKQNLEIKPITVLIGKNNSGKSAVLKLLPLLELSLSGKYDNPIELGAMEPFVGYPENELLYGIPNLSGDLEFELFKENEQENLQVVLSLREGQLKIKKWQFGSISLDEEEDELYIDKDDQIYLPEFRGFQLYKLKNSMANKEENIPNGQLTNKNLYTDYISGFRKEADPYYPYDGKLYDKSGLRGENLYSFLIDDTQTTNKKYFSLISNWIKEHFEGWELRVEYDGYRKDLPARIFLEKGTLKVNLSQTGTGISQVLPLLIRAYKPCNQPTTIIVEEPESHLHPYAHAQLAQLIFESTELDINKRYLIETHSQNFVLRLRRLVAEGKLKNDDLRIYYVDYDEDDNYSELKNIKIDNLGRVDWWPDGVFSETLSETIGIRTAQIDKGYVDKIR